MVAYLPPYASGNRHFGLGRRLEIAARSELCVGPIDSKFEVALSIALYAEWQAVLTRPEHLPPGQGSEQALAFLRYLAVQCHLQDIFYLWRPCLKDADDDMILELAVAARCSHILTHNLKDFRGAENFGITAIAPGDFYHLIQSTP